MVVCFGWGLCQISMAFFFSVFLNSSQTASIVGYSLSIWATTIASTLNVTVYSYPNYMSWYLYPFPTFPFCRVMYHLAMECAYGSCYKQVSQINEETRWCLTAIYTEAVIYLVLALYLNEVVPQTYGVPKHPCFCLKRKGKKNGFLQNLLFGKKEKYEGHLDTDLSNEDADSKEERNTVKRLDPN